MEHLASYVSNFPWDHLSMFIECKQRITKTRKDALFQMSHSQNLSRKQLTFTLTANNMVNFVFAFLHLFSKVYWLRNSKKLLSVVVISTLMLIFIFINDCFKSCHYINWVTRNLYLLNEMTQTFFISVFMEWKSNLFHILVPWYSSNPIFETVKYQLFVS